MKNFKDRGFKKDRGSFGGKPKFGGGKRFDGGGERGGRGGDDAELFPARCSSCQVNCEVPFRPSSDKPVYCSACFNKKNSNSMREFNKGNGNRRDDNRGDSRAPYAKKFEHHEHTPSHTANHGSEDIKRQLAQLESKLNRVIEMVQALKAPVAKVETNEKPAVHTSASAQNMTKGVVKKAIKSTPVAPVKKVVVAAKKEVVAKKEVAAAKKAPAKKVATPKKVAAPVKKVVAKKAPAKKVVKK